MVKIEIGGFHEKNRLRDRHLTGHETVHGGLEFVDQEILELKSLTSGPISFYRYGI